MTTSSSIRVKPRPVRVLLCIPNPPCISSGTSQHASGRRNCEHPKCLQPECIGMRRASESGRCWYMGVDSLIVADVEPNCSGERCLSERGGAAARRSRGHDRDQRRATADTSGADDRGPSARVGTHPGRARRLCSRGGAGHSAEKHHAAHTVGPTLVLSEVEAGEVFTAGVVVTSVPACGHSA